MLTHLMEQLEAAPDYDLTAHLPSDYDGEEELDNEPLIEGGYEEELLDEEDEDDAEEPEAEAPEVEGEAAAE